MFCIKSTIGCNSVSNIYVRLVMDVLYDIFKSLHLGDELPDVIRLINDKKQMEFSNRDKILLELNEMELKITDKKIDYWICICPAE